MQKRKKYLRFMFIIFIIFFGCKFKKNQVYKFKNPKQYFFGLYFLETKTNNLIVKLFENTSKGYRLFSIKDNELIDYNNKKLKSITNVFFGKNIKKIKYYNNNEIKKHCTGAIKINSNKYFLSMEYIFQKEEFFIFDGFKLNKVDTGNITPMVSYGDSQFTYDDKTGKIFFSGFYKEKRQIIKGIYSYNIKNKKFEVIKQSKNSYLIAPQIIYNKNRIIFFEDKNGLLAAHFYDIK